MLAALSVLAVTFLVSQSAAQVPSEEEVSEAKGWLSAAQLLSFEANREYCGYLGRLPDGTITTTDLVRGGHDGCTPVFAEDEMELSASLHTHGAYDPSVPAEFPTSLDIASDAREGVNGFVSTPGGRLWFIDGTRKVATQLCGLGCLPQDPFFRAGDDGVIRQSYTIRQLRRLEQSQ